MIQRLRMHRINGESIEVPSVDAHEATRNHPNEWSLTPFSAEQIRAYQDSLAVKQDAP